MALPAGLNQAQIDEVGYMDGLSAGGTLNSVNGWLWNNDNPATYSNANGGGFKWGGGAAGTGATVSYFLDAGSGWTADESLVWTDSLSLWSSIANVTFTQAGSAGAANLVLYRNPSSTPPAGQSGGAYATPVYTAGQAGSTTVPTETSALVSLQTGNNGDYFNFNGTFTTLFAGQGSGSGIATAIHEIGHTLGLAHPGPYNANVDPATQQFGAYDSWLYTTMSYIAPSVTTARYYSQYAVTGTDWGSSGGFGREPTTPQILDIAAVQQIYGTSTSSNLSGGQIFGFNTNIAASIRPFYDFTVNTTPVVTLWDGGTGNTLDLSGYGSASIVNLAPGSFSSVAGLVNNLGIAFGTRIDTAIGGAGNDIFSESGTGNVIDGGAGSNTVKLKLNRADYTMTRTPSNVVTVTASNSGVVDTLSNITTLQFADGSTLLAADIPCYARGTRIAVPGGHALVEHLAVGQPVLTARGHARPVKWIGQRAYAGPFLHTNPGVQPVRVAAGAIADGVPSRDLFISPRHALFLDGLLVPAIALLNGASITQCTDWALVEYFHVELDSHDILLAESCPAESFVDDQSRGMFQNQADFHARYPDQVPVPAAFCSEVVEDGEPLEAIRRAIAARAGLPTPGAAAPGVLDGRFDVLEHDHVAGWAVDQSGSPVRLELVSDDRVIARFTANRMRPDVRQAGFGDGRSGFHLRIPRLDPALPHRVDVRRASDGAVLGTRTLPANPSASGLDAVRAVLGTVAACHDAATVDRVIHLLDEQAERLRHGRRSPPPSQARRPRALFIDDALPAPGRDAGSCAALSHMASLQRLGWDVSFAASAVQARDTDTGALDALGIATLLAPRYSSIELLLREHARQFQLVYLHRLGNAAQYSALVRAHCPEATLLYSVGDLHHLRLAGQAAVEQRADLAQHADRVRRQELLAAAQADTVLTHSTEEADVLRRAVPGIDVQVVPWTIAASPVSEPWSRRHGVGFLGHYGHAPNVDAAIWLARTIMPLVWRTHPGIVLYLAGSAMPAAVTALAGPGVTVLGAVGHPAGLHGQVRVTAAALRYGAGVKGKVLDSLAAGVPVAMTTVAAQGIPGEWPVADTAEGLAAEIVRLHGNEAANAAAAARGLALIERQNAAGRVDMALRLAAGRLPARRTG